MLLSLDGTSSRVQFRGRSACNSQRLVFELRLRSQSREWLPRLLRDAAEGKTMRRTVRAGCVGLALATVALQVSPGRAQSSEEVKPVFEHAIPNIEGKRMVAVVVTYPAGGKSMAHHHAKSAFITLSVVRCHSQPGRRRACSRLSDRRRLL